MEKTRNARNWQCSTAMICWMKMQMPLCTPTLIAFTAADGGGSFLWCAYKSRINIEGKLEI